MGSSVRLALSAEKGHAALLLLVAACSSSASTNKALPSSSVSATPLLTTSASGAVGAPLHAVDAKKMRALLNESRKLEKEQHWKEAQTKLSEASALAPDDVTVLAELGWTALHAEDLETAKRVSDRALDLATDRPVRAQILYNLGRVAEAQKDPNAARELYEKSLALRPSKTVEERLAIVGGKAPAAPPPPDVPCNRTFENTASL
jgi:tetratricopeptide (TPR) repeat protein